MGAVSITGDPDVAPTQAPQVQGKVPATEADRAARIRKLAVAVWTEMERLGIVPTPRAYEVWFAYRTGASTVLSERIGALLDRGEALTPSVLDTLHGELLLHPEVDFEALSGSVDEIHTLAQSLVDQVAGGQAAMSGYGELLSHWADTLPHEKTMGGLVAAVGTLTAETIRAVERSRALEQQLSASAARIAKLRRSLADVKQETTTDALTGIANRKAFEAKLRRAVSQARLEPTSLTSVLLLDVDHFKRFNDAYGHHTGDLVLRLVGRLLSDNVKGRDMVARYGGEEFAILLAGAGHETAAVVARQICRALSSKQLVTRPSQGSVDNITISIGVAQHRAGESMASLIERADAALYRAKDLGRNRVCTDAEMLQAA